MAGYITVIGNSGVDVVELATALVVIIIFLVAATYLYNIHITDGSS